MEDRRIGKKESRQVKREESRKIINGEKERKVRKLSFRLVDWYSLIGNWHVIK